MKLFATSGLFLFLFLQDSCGPQTGYNFDGEASFSTYKTYRWVELKGGRGQVNDIVDKNIRQIVDQNLAAKGLQKVDAESADVYIGYTARNTREKQYNTLYSPPAGPMWGYGPGWRRGWGWGYGGGPTLSTTTSSTIVTRHLVLDMYDSRQHRLVWQGTVAQELDRQAKPEKKYKNLKGGIDKMLEHYPPQAPPS